MDGAGPRVATGIFRDLGAGSPARSRSVARVSRSTVMLVASATAVIGQQATAYGGRSAGVFPARDHRAIGWRIVPGRADPRSGDRSGAGAQSGASSGSQRRRHSPGGRCHCRAAPEPGAERGVRRVSVLLGHAPAALQRPGHYRGRRVRNPDEAPPQPANQRGRGRGAPLGSESRRCRAAVAARCPHGLLPSLAGRVESAAGRSDPEPNRPSDRIEPGSLRAGRDLGTGVDPHRGRAPQLRGRPVSGAAGVAECQGGPAGVAQFSRHRIGRAGAGRAGRDAAHGDSVGRDRGRSAGNGA